LRVALRRCRSLADGLIAIDPDPNWKAMKKAGKRLFQRLGDLRDVQIMMEWLEKLEPHPVRADAGDPSTSLRGGSPAYPAAESPAGNDGASPEAVAIPPAPDPAISLLHILRLRETEQKH